MLLIAGGIACFVLLVIFSNFISDRMAEKKKEQFERQAKEIVELYWQQMIVMQRKGEP